MTESKRDHINHPRHYTAGRVECIDYIEAQNFGYHEGNIVKYVTRYKYKNGLEDLRKAQKDLQEIIAEINRTLPHRFLAFHDIANTHPKVAGGFTLTSADATPA